MDRFFARVREVLPDLGEKSVRRHLLAPPPHPPAQCVCLGENLFARSRSSPSPRAQNDDVQKFENKFKVLNVVFILPALNRGVRGGESPGGIVNRKTVLRFFYDFFTIVNACIIAFGGKIGKS